MKPRRSWTLFFAFSVLLPLLLREAECQGWPSQQRQIFQQAPAPRTTRYKITPIPNEERMTNPDPRQELAPSPPKLVTRKFIRRDILPQDTAQGQGPVNQARFFSWLFGGGYPSGGYPGGGYPGGGYPGGGYPGGYPPYPPVPDHGPEYCVEYFDPYTGITTEDCTPLY